MKKTLEILKALSDENRLRIVMVLQKRPMCVCEIFELLNISGATLSAHLKILKNAGIIDLKKDGRFIEYSILKDTKIIELIDNIEKITTDMSIFTTDRNKASILNRDLCNHKYSCKNQ